MLSASVVGVARLLLAYLAFSGRLPGSSDGATLSGLDLMRGLPSASPNLGAARKKASDAPKRLAMLSGQGQGNQHSDTTSEALRAEI